MELIDRLIDYKNIHLAYERVKNGVMNKELNILDEEKLFEQCIPEIYNDIIAILKKPSNYLFRPIEILDKPKEFTEDRWYTRRITKICFFDAVIIQCVTNIIAELIGCLLPRENYGYILNSSSSPYMYNQWKRGYSKFIENEILARDPKSGNNFILEVDIKDFYPSINISKLKNELNKYIVDGQSSENSEILKIWLEKILNIKSINALGGKVTSKGLPQGPLYSPLLAMFYIRKVYKDVVVEIPGVLCFGYVDDLRFYCKSKNDAELVKKRVTAFLKKLDLKVNKVKTQVFEVSDSLRKEAKIMAKASNLNRAIADDIILSATSKDSMKDNLLSLLEEAKKIYGDSEFDKQNKFIERVSKFVSYRLVRLCDSISDWKRELDELNSEAGLTNYITMLHALFLTANSVECKKILLEKLKFVIRCKELDNLSYIKYISFQYLFIWSPTEMRLTDYDIKGIINIVEECCVSSIYMKGILSRCNDEWIHFLRQCFSKIYRKKRIDLELEIMLNKKLIIGNIPSYYNRQCSKSLQQYDDIISYYSPIQFTNSLLYLKSERFKNICYSLFECRQAKTNSNGVNWESNINLKQESLKEKIKNLNEEKIFNILSNLFQWLDIQLNYYDENIPLSVIDSNYIWTDEAITEINIFGNPALNEDFLYYDVPKYKWRTKFVELFELLFGINIGSYKDTIILSSVTYWKFRIIELLRARNFNLKEFVAFVSSILKTTDIFMDTNADAGHYKLSHLLYHYIHSPELHDNMLAIGLFVEQSWKNGSKECNFYTLHNHEHSLVLIDKIHKIMEESGFSIFINEKEAFRLFAACYLHDIGMLAAPSNSFLYDIKDTKIIDFNKELNELSEVAITKEELDFSNLKFIYNLHRKVETVRENIVREKHPYISSNEILSDYPKLPINVAERRDISELSLSHGYTKKDVDKIRDDLKDYNHPIRLKLLAHLLRLSDLCDAAANRVAKEVIERNADRMSDISIFHWIKHMSTDSIRIHKIGYNHIKPLKEEINLYSELSCNPCDKMNIVLTYNYMPSIYVDAIELHEKCGNNCKGEMHCVDSEMHDIIKKFEEVRYFERYGCRGIYEFISEEKCSIDCLFINRAYRNLFEEVIYLNHYFYINNINIVLDFIIDRGKNFRRDFNYINNRSFQKSADEFLISYLL
jgi:hypothetical protein